MSGPKRGSSREQATKPKGSVLCLEDSSSLLVSMAFRLGVVWVLAVSFYQCEGV
jgi:hypothetical protein